MTKITIEGDFSFEDKALREWFDKMQTQIITINERTKQHTLDIRELKKSINSFKVKGNV
jgi:hypothetical protein